MFAYLAASAVQTSTLPLVVDTNPTAPSPHCLAVLRSAKEEKSGTKDGSRNGKNRFKRRVAHSAVGTVSSM